MASVFPTSNYGTEAIVLAGTTKTDIITVPSGFWYDVTNIRVTLGTGSGGTAAIIYWYDASTATEIVLNEAAVVTAGVGYELELMPLHIEVGDIIRAKAAANYHVIVNYVKGSRQTDSTGAALGPARGSGFAFGPVWRGGGN